MKLLVFGATGETGRELVKQSLKLGHFVTVLVRDLQKMDIRHDNLEVIKGDARDLSSFESVLAGKDAVLSCIGTRECRGPFQFTSLYSDTMKNMILAMKRNDVKRIVAVTSWCTQPGPNNPWFIEWFLKPFIIGAILRDMAIMEEMLAKTDEDMINYTIVRPPRLLSEQCLILHAETDGTKRASGTINFQEQKK
ncbi:flavin reductase (NADPH)-like isoform X2 [Xenia sp. Carnegie-2017]|uniref:flavin reductase (NADPH)-like isoform X2 n=1 Tax=Xenia sp. Carnegie-2017 TaxID=2897299 RepID=UPI001F04B900|nr:flavin reductase (NADPH)-like isoform X2 [Xenia sp. Carnegie-2017]